MRLVAVEVGLIGPAFMAHFHLLLHYGNDAMVSNRRSGAVLSVPVRQFRMASRIIRDRIEMTDRINREDRGV